MQAIQYLEKVAREGFLSHKNDGQQVSKVVNPNHELNTEYFKNSLKFVIKQGGDTDTNACIIGGLMGALVGFDQLPSEYLVKQLSLRFRPAYRNSQARLYEPRSGFCNFLKLARRMIRVG
jgi:hypothetical protein